MKPRDLRDLLELLLADVRIQVEGRAVAHGVSRSALVWLDGGRGSRRALPSSTTNHRRTVKAMACHRAAAVACRRAGAQIARLARGRGAIAVWPPPRRLLRHGRSLAPLLLMLAGRGEGDGGEREWRRGELGAAEGEGRKRCEGAAALGQQVDERRVVPEALG